MKSRSLNKNSHPLFYHKDSQSKGGKPKGKECYFKLIDASLENLT